MCIWHQSFCEREKLTSPSLGISNETTKPINKKCATLEKLCQYKNMFEEIGLAIVLPETPTSHAENHFIKWIIEKINESDNSFDFYYVISNRFCSFWNYRKKHCTKNFLTAKESERLCTIARMTAEGELSLNDLEWQ